MTYDFKAYLNFEDDGLIFWGRWVYNFGDDGLIKVGGE